MKNPQIRDSFGLRLTSFVKIKKAGNITMLNLMDNLYLSGFVYSFIDLSGVGRERTHNSIIRHFGEV